MNTDVVLQEELRVLHPDLQAVGSKRATGLGLSI